jgi:hypothetical protein
VHVGANFSNQLFGNPPTNAWNFIPQAHRCIPVRRYTITDRRFIFIKQQGLRFDVVRDLRIKDRNLLVEEVDVHQMLGNQKAMVVAHPAFQRLLQRIPLLPQLTTCEIS